MAFEMSEKVSFTPCHLSSIIARRCCCCESVQLQEFLEGLEGSSYLDCNRRIQAQIARSEKWLEYCEFFGS